MKVNDYRFWKSRIETAPANSRGAFDQFVQDQRPMAQEPRNMADGGRIPFAKAKLVTLDPANLKRQQDGLQTYYDKFGKETLDKLSKKRHGKVFSKLNTDDLSNFKRRITKFENFITENNRMPTEKEARSIGRQPRIQKEQVIQIKLLEETNKGKFFDAEKFAKANNISMKELKKEAGRLQNNIYNKRMKMSGKEMRRVLDWIPDDASVSDNALNKLWKSKLIKYERNKIEELFYDAFGREFVKGTKDKNPNFNPKKHLAIRNNLTEYYKLREAINLKYPNINLALDHPLSKSTLKKVFNATPDQLTRVNPLEADLNNGFKDSLSLQYEKAIQGKNITQKKAVEKIARDLKLNIGKVSDDATNFKYGVKEFQKLNIKDEILKAVQTQADLNSNFKSYVKQNPNLFKTANINPNTNITKVTQGQVKKIATLLEKFGCGQAAGGRILMKNGGATLTECAIAGQKKLKLGLTNGFDKTEGELAKKILQAGRGMGSMFALRNILGPAAVGFTVAAEAGLVGYDMLATGKSFKEAVGASLFNYALGDKTQIDNKKLRYQGYKDAGVDENQIGKISAFENAMDEMNNLSAEFNEENRLYNIATNQKGRGRMDPKRYEKTKQQQAENFYNQADKNKALIQDLARTQTEDRLDKALDPMVPAIMSDADAKRKAMQMTKPSTVGFGNVMDTIFPSGFFSGTTYEEDRDKAVNYMPEVQEYYRGNRFAKGGLSGGDTSGRPPESGPMSQGLRSLYKNGRKL